MDKNQYENGAQTIGLDYILVHRSVKQQFLNAPTAEIKASEFSFEAGTYTQIINDRNVERVAGLIDLAKVYYGGKVDR